MTGCRTVKSTQPNTPSTTILQQSVLIVDPTPLQVVHFLYAVDILSVPATTRVGESTITLAVFVDSMAVSVRKSGLVVWRARLMVSTLSRVYSSTTTRPIRKLF